MKLIKLKYLVPVLVALLFAGCSSNVGRFTVVSTKVVPANLSKEKYVEGESCVTYIFGIPAVGQTNNRVGSAIDDAIEKANANGIATDALVNVSATSFTWSVLLVTRNCVVVRGQPLTAKTSQILNK